MEWVCNSSFLVIKKRNEKKKKKLVLFYITCNLADTFIQSDLQLSRLSRRHSPLEQCGVKGLAQGPNNCADLIVAAPGLEPPTLRVQVKLLNRYAAGCLFCF